jgi:hypothetical protein
MKLTSSQSKGLINILILFVLAVAVYIGFEPLINLAPDGVAKSVISSAFGAIFVIILTMYLLNKQTEIEQESKRGEIIYSEKINQLKAILDSIEGMMENSTITGKDVEKLDFNRVRIYMVCSKSTIECFGKLQKKIIEIHNEREIDAVEVTSEQRKDIIQLLEKFSNECRIDLQPSEERFEKTFLDKATKDVDKEKKNKENKDRSKYEFKGEKLGKTPYIREIVKAYARKFESKTFAEFEKKIPAEHGSSETKHKYIKPLYVPLSEAEDIFKETGYKRHYTDEKHRITFSDNKTICVTNQQNPVSLELWVGIFKKAGIDVGKEIQD